MMEPHNVSQYNHSLLDEENEIIGVHWSEERLQPVELVSWHTVHAPIEKYVISSRDHVPSRAAHYVIRL